MEGEARRARILEILNEESAPVSGSKLAALVDVSRQVIVQDIALLRAVNQNILSTNKGYILFVNRREKEKFKKSFKVKHSYEEITDELNTMIDNGGRVLDVAVEHSIYGQITADLKINNRADVESFVGRVHANKTKPLYDLTNGVHFHTVEADDEATLTRIEERLGEKGYLII